MDWLGAKVWRPVGIDVSMAFHLVYGIAKVDCRAVRDSIE